MRNMDINFEIHQKIENDEKFVIVNFSSLLANDIVYRSVYIGYRYTLLKYDACFLQRANIFISDKMTNEKCFTTMVP